MKICHDSCGKQKNSARQKQQSTNDTSQSAETVLLLRRMDDLGGYWMEAAIEAV
jgi:hypothetical protein